MLLYHGTTSSVAKAALKEGLKPRSVTKKSNWKHTIHSNKNCIYLTDAYPLFFAVQAANGEGESPAILEIDTDYLMEDDLVPDEDVLEQANRGKDGLPEDWDMKKRTRWYRTRLRDYQHAWETSLKAMGTCAHFGEIPAYAIRRVAIIDHKKQAGLCWMAMDAMLILMNYRFVGDKYKAITNWVFENDFDDPAQDKAFAALGVPTTRQTLEKQGRDGIKITENKGFLGF